MKYSIFISILTVMTLFVMVHATPTKQRIVIDDFENGLGKKWEEKSFRGKTVYKVVKLDGNSVLMAESSSAASGLIYKYEFSPNDYPLITWRWMVKDIIKTGDATRKEGDDYPARLYVVFPHWFPPLTKSLNYIWANKLPKGEMLKNTYFSGAVMIAVESGRENIGKWINESRNLYEDYKKAFGKEPGMAGAIAIMTDTDQTGEHAVAFYDDIVLKSATDR